MQTITLAEVLQKKFIGTEELRRELSDILTRFSKEVGELVVTQHGVPQAVLIDLESYLNSYETLEDLQKPGFIESIYKELKEIDKGKCISHEQLKKNLGI